VAAFLPRRTIRAAASWNPPHSAAIKETPWPFSPKYLFPLLRVSECFHAMLWRALFTKTLPQNESLPLFFVSLHFCPLLGSFFGRPSPRLPQRHWSGLEAGLRSFRGRPQFRIGPETYLPFSLFKLLLLKNTVSFFRFLYPRLISARPNVLHVFFRGAGLEGPFRGAPTRLLFFFSQAGVLVLPPPEVPIP